MSKGENGEKDEEEDIVASKDWENARGEKIKKIEKTINLRWKHKVRREEVETSEILRKILRIEKVNRAQDRQKDFKIRWGEKVRREERLKLGREKGEECWLINETKKIERQDQKKDEIFEI